jgi:hypothetical protein
VRINKFVLAAIMIFAISAVAAYAEPEGAIVTLGVEERGNVSQAPGNATAAGGNITNVNLTATTITEAWHGFYGQIAGNISLEDSAGFRMYAWAFGATGGEVFASRSNAVAWATIAAENDCTTDEALTGTGSDRTNLTFTASSNSAFTVGTTNIAANSACSTHTYVNSTAQAVDFEEVILDDTTNIVYTGLLENNAQGFDNGNYDFQIIVPDNRTSAVETYYFYAELS